MQPLNFSIRFPALREFYARGFLFPDIQEFRERNGNPVNVIKTGGNHLDLIGSQ